MRNIKLIYKYDGSDFYGFQRQPHLRTVQGELEKAINKVTKEKINLISSGRTDKNVHALEQVSNFLTDTNISSEKLLYILNKTLPKDIYIANVSDESLDFHARFSAKTREYVFFLTWQKDMFKRKYYTFIDKPICCEVFEKILIKFLGIHDFNNFRLSGCSSLTSVREISKISLTPIEKDILKINIEGNSFLKSQIRIMIGTALAEYYGKIEVDRIDEMLKNPNKQFKKIVISPEGLYLSKINY